MAFINRIGNLLKHSAVKHINQDLSASNPSIFQAIRSMSSAKLFVGGTLVYCAQFFPAWNIAINFKILFALQVFHIAQMR